MPPHFFSSSSKSYKIRSPKGSNNLRCFSNKLLKVSLSREDRWSFLSKLKINP